MRSYFLGSIIVGANLFVHVATASCIGNQTGNIFARIDNGDVLHVVTCDSSLNPISEVKAKLSTLSPGITWTAPVSNGVNTFVAGEYHKGFLSHLVVLALDKNLQINKNFGNSGNLTKAVGDNPCRVVADQTLFDSPTTFIVKGKSTYRGCDLSTSGDLMPFEETISYIGETASFHPTLPQKPAKKGDFTSEIEPKAMYWADAAGYCGSKGKRLPSAREVAEFAMTRSAEGISETPKQGYKLVKTTKFDGSIDQFYYSPMGFKRGEHYGSTYKVWTSSPSLEFAYAHYYFDYEQGFLIQDIYPSHGTGVWCFPRP